MRWHLVLGAVVFLLTSVLILACGGGEEAQPSPAATGTPTAAVTPSPSAEEGGWESFRAFAAQIEAAVAGNDVDFFMDRAAFQEVVCPTPPAELEPCEEAGQIVQVVTEARQGLAVRDLLDADLLRESLAGFFQGGHAALSDEYGDGQVRLYCISHRLDLGGQDEYRAVVTKMRTGAPSGEAVRELLILKFRFEDGRWQFGRFATETSRPGYDVGQDLTRQPDDLDWEKR